MPVPPLILLALGAAVLSTLAVVWLYQKLRKHKNENDAVSRILKERLHEQREALQRLTNQIDEMQTRSLVQGRHMQELSELCANYSAQLQEVRMQDPSVRLYSRAAELVQNGASIEEIMQACDLPRAEVELLTNLSRKF